MNKYGRFLAAFFIVSICHFSFEMTKSRKTPSVLKVPEERFILLRGPEASGLIPGNAK